MAIAMNLTEGARRRIAEVRERMQHVPTEQLKRLWDVGKPSVG